MSAFVFGFAAPRFCPLGSLIERRQVHFGPTVRFQTVQRAATARSGTCSFVGITVHGLQSVGRELIGLFCLLAFDPLALSFGLQAERHPVLFGHHRAVTRPYNRRLRRGPALAQECLGQHGKPKDRATKGAGKPKNR